MNTRTTQGRAKVARPRQNGKIRATGDLVGRPILFCGPLVRALLDGRKTMTRRLSRAWLRVKKGDRLWVRETWTPAWAGPLAGKAAVYRADHHESELLPVGVKWRPSIHMPRALSRIDLEATEDAREERLQAITEDDAKAEGVRPLAETGHEIRGSYGRDGDQSARAAFCLLWEDINGDKAPWASNPLVVVLSFKVIRPDPLCHATSTDPGTGFPLRCALPAHEKDLPHLADGLQWHDGEMPIAFGGGRR